MLRLDQLQMFGDRVLVDPDAKHVTSEGGLHIPQTVLADNPNYFNMTGIVLQLGDGVMRHTFQCLNCNSLAPQDEGPCPGCHQPLGNFNTRLFESSDARYEFGVAIGERVLFNRYAGKQVELELPDVTGDLTGPTALGQIPQLREQFGWKVPSKRFLIMRESEILGVVEGDHRIVPGYMAPKWGKVTEGLTV